MWLSIWLSKLQEVCGSIAWTSQLAKLWSVISGLRGVKIETEARVGKAFATLNRHSKIFSSQLRISYKMKYLQSYVHASLTYIAECANHVQLDIEELDAFLNACRARILCSPYRREGWRRIEQTSLKGQLREMVFCLNPSHLVQIERIKFFFSIRIIIY
jgi:hypothetical protein